MLGYAPVVIVVLRLALALVGVGLAACTPFREDPSPDAEASTLGRPDASPDGRALGCEPAAPFGFASTRPDPDAGEAGDAADEGGGGGGGATAAS